MAAFPPSEPLLGPVSHPYGFQGAEILTSASGSAADSTVTLLIRHLPEAIPHDTLSRLFSHYGASAVRPCTSGRLKGCAFVDFKSEGQAYQAQRQLNGLRFLGKLLVVERASSSTKGNEIQHGGAQLATNASSSTSLSKSASSVREIGENLKMGSDPVQEPIAPKLGIDYPFPPRLEYAYPPPDGNILTNIVNALIAVPRFYTQVLHLMNKMNIPAPFRMALPTPPLPPAVPPPPPPPPAPTAAKPLMEELSESESEMESSEEEVDEKEHASESSRIRSGKKRKREAIVGPAVDKGVTHEAVGVKPATLFPKEIPMIKKNVPILQIKIAPKVAKTEEKYDGSGGDEHPQNEKLNFEPFAAPEELERGKLPLEEILSLPKFKNYTAGNPSPVLYIKNLGKDVVQDDFYFIFGSLFGNKEAAKSNLSVKLMQEGRMRGQAFVTFPSIELAHNALNLANRYVFKGKPMIIQFGRNAAAAKTNSADLP